MNSEPSWVKDFEETEKKVEQALCEAQSKKTFDEKHVKAVKTSLEALRAAIDNMCF